MRREPLHHHHRGHSYSHAGLDIEHHPNFWLVVWIVLFVLVWFVFNEVVL